MFGSDWPVALLSAQSYADVVSLASSLTAKFSQDENERFWELTALEKYQITNL
jgi:L-fuconolactonase